MIKRSFEEEALPERFNLSIWGRVLKYAWQSWPLLLVLLLSLLFTTFYDSSLVPVLNAGAIAAVESSPYHGDLSEVVIPVTFIFNIQVDFSFWGYAITQVVLLVVRSFFIFWTFFLTNIIGMRIMVALRRDTFRKIQELSFSYFDKTSSGWLVARMNNDTSSLGDVLGWGVVRIMWSLGNFLFTLVTMFTVNWIYSLIIFASIPLLLIVLPFFQKAQLKRHRIARNAYSDYVRWLAESIDGAKTIKSLGIENEVDQEADEITTEIRNKRFYAMRLDAYFQPFVSFLSSAVTCIIMVYGLVYDQREAAAITATLVLFVSFATNIYSPIQSLAEIFGEFLSAQAGAEKIMQILDAVPEIQDSQEVVAKYGTLFDEKAPAFKEDVEGHISFEKVSFSYIKGVEVLHPLDLDVPSGTSLAVVGHTGSGKTTLVNLLCRFYEPDKGSIKIDGIDLKDRSLGWLRRHIGYVQQNPFVFTGTYLDNIRYGKLDAPLEEVIKAAKTVGIHDFIMSQKEGYDTFLEDGGGTLSQGQKQLISFARALVRNPAILILDEATSSIDTETEAEVQASLLKLLKGRTSIVIAHRLSTIVHSDRILVMQGGSIIEDGNHASLMKQKGHYYELYTNQFKELSISSQLSLEDTL